MNFWDTLLSRKPIVGLSPMDGVTDLPMRWMIAKYGNRKTSLSDLVTSSLGEAQSYQDTKKQSNYSGVGVIFTEFVSVDGLVHAKTPESVARLMSVFLRLQEIGGLTQYPYQVAQVFGHDPRLFYTAAVIVASLGYDGMDINMGCPAKNVSERGSGAGLIRTPEIAQEIVRQAKKGVKDYVEGKITVQDLEISDVAKEWVRRHTPAFLSDLVTSFLGEAQSYHDTKKLRHDPIPISIKTRLGVDSIVVEEWMKTLMEVEPVMITLHGRTLKQLYQGEANWDEIGKAARVVHELGGHILGNGDIESVTSGKLRVERYGVDGFLIGRAAEGNPGIFAGLDSPTWEQRKEWMLEHARIYEEYIRFSVSSSLRELPSHQVTEILSHNFVPMRKHLAWYCKGFPGASELREKLVRTSSASDLSLLLQQFAQPAR